MRQHPIAQESAHDGTDHGAAVPLLQRRGDWRVADGGACAFFPTGSFAAGARFVQAVAELPGLDDHAPDVDLRPGRRVRAGGRVVSDAMAPSGWVLADPEGNEACVATWIGTDGRGYP